VLFRSREVARRYGGASFGNSAKEDLDLLESLDFGINFRNGSLKPRPSVSPWDDKFGDPSGGLKSGVQRALGLPYMDNVVKA
jgi:hypothetical protein